MIPTAALVLVSAFLLAEEKERGSKAWTHFDSLKQLLIEGFHLAWQLGVLALICANLKRAETFLAGSASLEKSLCVAGAWLLSRMLGKSPAYFTVLAALALGMTNVLPAGWEATLFFLGRAIGGVSAIQILMFGMKERLLLARIPQTVEGLPLALLSFSLIILTVLALGF